MNLSSLFPPTILARLLEDLGAVADAARRLPELEREVLQRVDTMATELVAVREEITAVRKGMEGLREDVAPIKEIVNVRRASRRWAASWTRCAATCGRFRRSRRCARASRR